MVSLWSVVVVVGVSLWCSAVEGEQAGFRTTLSQGGLTYLKTIGLQLLEQQLQTLDIQDTSGEADTPIGKIDWSLSNIVLKSFAIPDSDLKIVPNEGISLALSSATCSVSMDWHYKKKHWPHTSDHGSADISVSQVSATVTIDVKAQNGRPAVNAASDNVDVGHLDIKLHGGASWLYKIFVDIFSNNIRHQLSSALTAAITKNINNGLNIALSSLPMTVPINRDVEIDYYITSNPDFTVDYLEVPMLGEFYQINNVSECPNDVCPQFSSPESVDSSKMLQMITTEYLANSAGYVFFNLGKLKAHVKDADLPSWSPIRLNTSSFEYLIPALYAKYPNQLLELVVYSTSPPNANFNPQGAIIKAIGNIDMMVVTDPSNNTLTLAFTLNGTVSTSGIALLNGDVLFGNLSYINGAFGLLNSNIGTFDVSLLNQLLAMMMSDGIVPAVNTYLKTGFQLPTVQGLTFNNPTIGWGDHFLSLSTDVNYIPPSFQSNHFPIGIN